MSSTRISRASSLPHRRLRRDRRRAAHDPLQSHENRGDRRRHRRLIIYDRAFVDLARHYGFQPRACRAYRAKTKGKVERPFRYIREDFFLGGLVRNLDDLNDQLRHWLDAVANPRVHATTNRIVNEAFAEEKP